MPPASLASTAVESSSAQTSAATASGAYTTSVAMSVSAGAPVMVACVSTAVSVASSQCAQAGVTSHATSTSLADHPPSVSTAATSSSVATLPASTVSTSMSGQPGSEGVSMSVSSQAGSEGAATPASGLLDEKAKLPSATTADAVHPGSLATTATTTTTTAAATTTAPASHSRPHLPPLSMGNSLHYPPDHPLAGQPRPPLDMLAHVSQSALSSAGMSLPISLSSTQPSPPTPGRQLSPDVMRMGFSRHMTPQMVQHMAQQGMSAAPGPPTSQHSPTMVFGGEGA